MWKQPRLVWRMQLDGVVEVQVDKTRTCMAAAYAGRLHIGGAPTAWLDEPPPAPWPDDGEIHDWMPMAAQSQLRERDICKVCLLLRPSQTLARYMIGCVWLRRANCESATSAKLPLGMMKAAKRADFERIHIATFPSRLNKATPLRISSAKDSRLAVRITA